MLVPTLADITLKVCVHLLVEESCHENYDEKNEFKDGAVNDTKPDNDTVNAETTDDDQHTDTKDADTLIPKPRASSSDKIPANKHTFYITQLLETNDFTCLSQDILAHIVKYIPIRLHDRLLKALVPDYVTALNLTNCKKLTKYGLANVIKRCHRLQCVDLSGGLCMLYPSSVTLHQLIKAPITTLLLRNNNNLNDVSVHTVLENMVHLSVLDISMSSCYPNGLVTDNAFLVYPEHQLQLEVSPNAACASKFKCKLKSLNISARPISFLCLKHVASLTGPSLQHLDLSNTKVDHLGLLYIAGLTNPAIVDFMLKEEVKNTDPSLTRVFETFRSVAEICNETYSSENEREDLMKNARMCQRCSHDSKPDNKYTENKQTENLDQSGASLADVDKASAISVKGHEQHNLKSSESGHVLKQYPSEPSSSQISSKGSEAQIVENKHKATENLDVNDSESSCDETTTDTFNNSVTVTRDCTKDSVPSRVEIRFQFDQYLYQPQLQSLQFSHRRRVNQNALLTNMCILQFLKANPSLQKLSMFAKITQEFMQEVVGYLRELRKLDLNDRIPLDDACVAILGRSCSKLEKVCFIGGVFGDAGILPLLTTARLTHLCLVECDNITDRTLAIISNTLADTLIDLDISYCEGITVMGLDMICDSCCRLKRLVAVQIPLSSQSLPSLAETARELKELNIQQEYTYLEPNEELRNSFLLACEHFNMITALNLNSNADINDSCIHKVLMYCVRLEKLYCECLFSITIQPFHPLVSGWVFREGSDVKSLLASDEDLERSTVFASNLRLLNVVGCDYIMEEDILRLVNICRGTLTILSSYE